MKNRYNKFFSDFCVFLFGSFGTKALSFLMVPFYTGILTPAEYGTIDLISTTCTLLMPLLTMGLLDAIFRFTMMKSSDKRDVLTIGLCAILTNGAISVPLLFCINLFLRWQYLWWMFAQLIASSLFSLFSNFIKAEQKLRLYVATGMLQTFLMLSLNILFLAKFRMGVAGYNTAVLISLSIPTALLLLGGKLYRFIRFQVNFTMMRVMLKYSIPLIFSSMAWWIISSSDKYMILYFYDEAQVGLYSVACKIPLILQTIITLLMTVEEIFLTSVYEEEETELRTVAETLTRWLSGLGYLLGSALVFACPFIMRVMAKNEFYAGWRFAPFLILALVYPFPSSVPGTLYMVYRRSKGVMISVVSGALINIFLNLWWIPAYGVMGAAASTLVSRLFIALYKMKDTERFLKFNRRYKQFFANNAILILQAVLLLKMSRHIFPVQLAVFLLILFLNWGIVMDGSRWGVSRFKRA